MAQIVAFPRTLVLTRAFQELPLFTQRAPNGDLFYAGLISAPARRNPRTAGGAPGGPWRQPKRTACRGRGMRDSPAGCR
jgi:hypothetical protein